MKNLAMKKTIASMLHGAIPSETDLSLFVKRLIYNLYIHRKSEGSTENVVYEDSSVIGGSAAKAAGENEHTVVDDDDVDEADNGDNNGASNDKIHDESHSQVETGNSEADFECEHNEPTAPKSFFPSNIFVVLTMGVLSERCEFCLDHVADKEGSNGVNKASVPT